MRLRMPYREKRRGRSGLSETLHRRLKAALAAKGISFLEWSERNAQAFLDEHETQDATEPSGKAP
jgi:hypothetical protein